jgi:acyl dehydratase
VMRCGFSTAPENSGPRPAGLLGSSGWILVDQARIDDFARATNDHQWIHVDRERARSGPFGGTIAHGLLTLSLVPGMNGEIYRVDGVRLLINYGYNRIRYPAPVPAGSRVPPAAGSPVFA